MKQKINNFIRSAKIYFSAALIVFIVLLLAGIFQYISIGYSAMALLPFAIGCRKVYQGREFELNQGSGW